MTTIEICNPYQMRITVIAIFSFISGRYCAKGNFSLIVFSAKEVPFLKVRLRKEDVCRYHFLLSIYSSIQCFFSRYDKYDSYYTFYLNHQHLPIMCWAPLKHTRTVNMTEHINLKKKKKKKKKTTTRSYFQSFESGKKFRISSLIPTIEIKKKAHGIKFK